MWKKAIIRSKHIAKSLKVFTNISNHAKLYGSTHNMMLEEANEFYSEGSCCSKIILMPDSTLHKYWDPIMVLCLLYTAFFIPYKIAFYDSDPHTIVWIDLIIDILFATDVIINFITAYDDENNKLIKNREI